MPRAAISASVSYWPARTDGQIPPSLLMLSNGTAGTQMTLDKAERLYLYAVHGCIGGQSGLMTVIPAARTILFSGPSTVTAGTVLRVSVTIRDNCGNGYNGPMSLTAGDGQKLNVTTLTMTGGQHHGRAGARQRGNHLLHGHGRLTHGQ